MAGAILVANNVGVSMNSVDFDYITEKIRSNFNKEEAAIREEIYSPVDDGGLSFISLTEQSDNGFNAFVRAASIAYESELKERPKPERWKCWDELMRTLRADPRADNL